MENSHFEIILCPNCNQRLRVPTSKVELKVTCPKCGAKFNFPPIRGKGRTPDEKRDNRKRSPAPVRGIRDFGMCQPQDVSDDPIPIISRYQIGIILNMLNQFVAKGASILALLGNVGKAFPPDSLRYAAALLRRDQRMAMLVWQKGHGLFARIKFLQELRDGGQIRDLAGLIALMQASTWTAHTVDFSVVPCPPFGDNPVPHLSDDMKTMIIPATPIIDSKKAEQLATEAQTQASTGSYTRSLQLLEQALDYNPTYAAALNVKAGVLIMLLNYEESIKVSDAVIELAPEFPNPWMNKGTALWQLGRCDEAAKCFRNASSLGDKRGDQALRDMGL